MRHNPSIRIRLDNTGYDSDSSAGSRDSAASWHTADLAPPRLSLAVVLGSTELSMGEEMVFDLPPQPMPTEGGEHDDDDEEKSTNTPLTPTTQLHIDHTTSRLSLSDEILSSMEQGHSYVSSLVALQNALHIQRLYEDLFNDLTEQIADLHNQDLSPELEVLEEDVSTLDDMNGMSLSPVVRLARNVALASHSVPRPRRTIYIPEFRPMVQSSATNLPSPTSPRSPYSPWLSSLPTSLPDFLGNITSYVQAQMFLQCFTTKLEYVQQQALDVNGLFIGNKEMESDLIGLELALAALREVPVVGR
ncbi:hypothetical protein HDU85_005751 [Gaertneriomyces sp. JEL0708]|nr:hypothetical protein HDU85_005751 [Gaertneriomyces sp. JEL0708]